jgi:hypothetical protein
MAATDPGVITVALDPTAPRPYKEGRAYEQTVILTLGDNYATGGVVVDLTGLNTPGFNPPFAWQFYPESTDQYHYVKGDDRGEGKITAWAGSSQHTDMTAWADATLKATFFYNPIGAGQTS